MAAGRVVGVSGGIRPRRERRAWPQTLKRTYMTLGRVFILESPNPLDLLEGRGERDSLQQVCRLLGHDVATFLIRDSREFRQTCEYISAIQGEENDKLPLFLHISLHGNALGIGIGREHMKWNDLGLIIRNMYEQLQYYHGPVILILSACGANKQRLTETLTAAAKAAKPPFIPPEYLFVFAEDKISWRDAVVTWTIVYRHLPMIDLFSNKGKVQQLLKRIHVAGLGTLIYYRWEKSSMGYLRYNPETS
jgi:hypothetical protein